MADQDFSIKITSTADTTGFKQQTEAAYDFSHRLGVIKVSNEDVEEATRKTSEALHEGAEKFSESRRETREAAGELGKLIGVHELGTAAMGKTGAAIFGMGAALDFLKETYDQITEAISGPLKIEVPADAPAHISSLATAWNEYAKARAAVIATANGPEGIESAAEKSLANELKLIKEVLTAERQKALSDLEMNRGQMSPEEYTASRDNISLIFDSADKAAERQNRQNLMAAREAAAANLEIDAQAKSRQAGAIHVAPKNVAEVAQKTLDADAAQAEAAQKELKERAALIERQRNAWAGGDVPEYEGADGSILRKQEEITFGRRYGSMGYESAAALENTRLAQAQAEIDRAANYRANQEQGKTQSDLETEAGKESGKAANLRAQNKADQIFQTQQDAADSYIASLHESSARQVVGASSETAAAVQKFTAATVGGFADVHKQFIAQQQQMDLLRQQIQEMARQH